MKPDIFTNEKRQKLKKAIQKNIAWLHHGKPIKDGDAIEIPEPVIEVLLDIIKFIL